MQIIVQLKQKKVKVTTLLNLLPEVLQLHGEDYHITKVYGINSNPYERLLLLKATNNENEFEGELNKDWKFDKLLVFLKKN